MSTIAENIIEVRTRIAEAAKKSGRTPEEVKLMGVTKTVDSARIREGVDAGLDMLGENYVQEAKRKIDALGKTVPWHFIGRLQTNKAKYAVKLFDMVESVNRIEIARELDRRAGQSGINNLKILIEVNLSGEETKSGVPGEKAIDLIREIILLPNLSIQGLMTMAPWSEDPETVRRIFSGLRELREKIQSAQFENVLMNELSMGMSGDFEVAVEEGATIVRIGTAIFGERK